MRPTPGESGSLACDNSDRDRYRAWEHIAAYACGKPKRGIELTGEDGGPLEIAVLTTEERHKRIAELLTRQAGMHKHALYDFITTVNGYRYTVYSFR